jgi:hypothetical protein
MGRFVVLAGPSCVGKGPLVNALRRIEPELTFAHRFDCVIANHDGEDSENWSAFYWPLGDAGRSVRLMTSLLRDEPVDGLEHWSGDLLSRYAQQS